MIVIRDDIRDVMYLISCLLSDTKSGNSVGTLLNREESCPQSSVPVSLSSSLLSFLFGRCGGFGDPFQLFFLGFSFWAAAAAAAFYAARVILYGFLTYAVYDRQTAATFFYSLSLSFKFSERASTGLMLLFSSFYVIFIGRRYAFCLYI